MRKNKTKKTILRAFMLLCLSAFVLSCFQPSVFAQCPKPEKNTELEVNNIRALFKTDGAHFFNQAGSAVFEVPKGSGQTSFFAASLWLGGINEENNLHLAAMRYGLSGNDYWTGPVSNAGAEAATYYDKFWSISREEVEFHKMHYTDVGYIMPEKIANWPAHGRSAYGESFKLASYKNVSGNNSYSPSQGDYPLIRGDQAMLWINNDNCSVHTESAGLPLGVEILNMAYAYNRPEYELQHTIFLSYEIRNKSANNYKDFYIGFFADFDIGFGGDDYIGCDTLLNLAYGYNGKNLDGSGEAYAYGEHPPAQGAMFLNQKMNAFIYFNNSSSDAMGDPRNAKQFYNLLQAKWKDGTPMTFGKNGYDSNSTDYTNFAFSGDPAATQTSWTEVTPNGEGSAPNIPGDRRGVLSAGPFTLPAGGSICIDIALPFARDLDGNNISSVAMLKQKAQAIQQFYNNQHYEMACTENIGIKENQNSKATLQIFPNPTKGQFVVSCNTIIESIELYDILGKKVFSCTPKEQTTQIKTQLSQGLYMYRALLQDSSICSGKILVQ